ncbi:polysaccharide deacetylase family protein [Couchioplanes caeruleus]|uniref:polysaccharide deacetylase family protein n=1 Tax=Couchioplanes caeruleus TaxID=56438 RepID=UPI00201BF160|nr:polysaccharide deacetylase family protein [Couchioplanes caeruleus]UQU65999.1 polysaccharide deacetylase family protein [Couchioplanes caeruleus]
MPPQSPDRPAPGRGSRHAATSERARFDALTGGTGGFPHVTVLEGETALGRHRRPESLADNTILRPPATQRIAGGRRATLDLSPRSRSGSEGRSAPRSKSASRNRSAGASAPGRPARGRHAKAADPLAITVRPLPAVRDAAGALRDWARADNGKPPVTGAHRAPGTLPIESWLLIGRHRQQALLATLVAVGLMLIVIPMQRGGGTDVNPINAADHAIVTTAVPAAKPPAKKPGDTPAAPAKQHDPAASEPATAAKPPAGKDTPSTAPSAAAPSAPAVLVPEGTGPAKSLRTTGNTTVALTFDDGPDPVQTPKILKLLDQYGAKATFCLVGDQVRRHPDIVRQIAAAGHTLCNHTWNHSLTIGKDKPEDIQKDLARTNEAIRAAVPGAEIPFFRAPGGNFTDRLVETAYTDGMTSLYWEVDPRDWDHPQLEDEKAHVDKVVNGVQQHVRPGSIVLSHDFNQPDTIAAYEKLLPWLTEHFTLGLPPQPKPPTAPAESAPASTDQ